MGNDTKNLFRMYKFWYGIAKSSADPEINEGTLPDSVPFVPSTIWTKYFAALVVPKKLKFLIKLCILASKRYI